MDNCCYNRNIVSVSAKCNDLFDILLQDGKLDTKHGVPYKANIGGGDYISFSFCANCGQMVGRFPIKLMEEDEADE